MEPITSAVPYMVLVRHGSNNHKSNSNSHSSNSDVAVHLIMGILIFVYHSNTTANVFLFVCACIAHSLAITRPVSDIGAATDVIAAAA